MHSAVEIIISVRGWMSLTRLGRYLHDKVDWVIEKKVDQQGIHEHNLGVQEMEISGHCYRVELTHLP